jgi:hypothetical protein
MIGTPESAGSEKRMAAHSMVGDASFSLAEKMHVLKKEGQRALNQKRNTKSVENRWLLNNVPTFCKRRVTCFTKLLDS